MLRLLTALLVAATPTLALDVPSGQPVTLQEVLIDDVGGESWLRFRFIAPEIARDAAGITQADAVSDMLHLCDALVIPYIAQYALTGDVIVISLADRETEFGVSDPESTQFFEAYRIVDNACIWEPL